MPEANQENTFDPDRYEDAEAELGGADAIPGTTYVTGEGTSPRRRRSDHPSAQAHGHGGSGVLIAVVVALMALVAVGYLLGVMR